MTNASSPPRRRQKIAEFFDSLPSVDFSEKWLVCHMDSDEVLRPPFGGVFVSEEEADQGRMKTGEPAKWQVVGPVRFATANSDQWWFKVSGEPHFMALGLKADQRGGIRLTAQLADGSTLEFDTSDPAVTFDLFLFNGEA